MREKRYFIKRKKVEITAFLREIGFQMEIEKKILQKTICLSGICEKFFKNHYDIFFCRIFLFFLLLKGEEKVSKKLLEVCNIQKTLSEKQFSFHYPIFSKENERVLQNFKTLQFFVENLILKILRFKINFRLPVDLHFPLELKKDLKKRDLETQISNFAKNYKPEKTNFGFFITPVIIDFSLECYSVLKVWFFLNLNDHFFPWWRIFNVRECEMEFFEQKAVFERCSTFTRKKFI